MESKDNGSRRLDSWKEIAAYFGKEVRTVRRWESERGLPVHRLPGNGRGSVYAFEHELHEWLSERRRTQGNGSPSPTAVEVHSPEPSAFTAHQLSEESPPSPDVVLPEFDSAKESAIAERSHMPSASWFRPRLGWALALVIAVATGFGVLAAAHGRRKNPPERPRAAAESVASNMAARDLYLQGRYLWNLRTEASLSQAVDLFTQAVVRDPQYAPAYAGLADCYLLLREFGSMTDEDAYERAYLASKRALALDDSSAEAHRSYAFVLTYWMRNFPAAEVEYRRAIQLDPNAAQTHHWYATSLQAVGRDSDAFREIEIARQLRPDSIAILADRGFIMRYLDPSDALTELLELERTNPDYPSIHRYISLLRLDRKQYDLFLSEFQAYFAILHRERDVAAIDRARTALASGGEAAMFTALANSFARLADAPESTDAIFAAFLFAQLHDRDQTLHYLTLSCTREETGCMALPSMREYFFLHGDKQYEALLTRSKTPMATPPVAMAALATVGMR